MTRAAVEIVRSLPAFADSSEDDLRDVVDGWASRLPPPSRGETLVIRWARITEELLAGCDAETVNAALEVVDRLRAGMVRVPADQPTLAELWDDPAAGRGEVA